MNRTINLLAVISCLVAGTDQVWATASVTKLANASISADTTGATYTTLSGPALTEGAAGDIGTGTIVLNAPAGFVFDTTAVVTATVSGAGGSGITLLLTSGVAVVTPNSITIIVVGLDVGSKRSKITWSGIRVRPTAGTPLAKGTLTNSGTAVLVGLNGTSSFGTLTEIAGRATHLAFTRQPGTATAGSAFGVQPIVSSQDQFGNTSTSGLPSSSYVTAALSSGTGPLQGTVNLNIGSGGGKGTATYQNLRIDVAGNNDQLTVASTNGLTSALSSVFTANPGPAQKLVIGGQPSAAATAGLAFSQQPVVLIEDNFNNIRTSDALAVTATRSSGTGALMGTTTVAAVNGVATFTDLAHPVAANITILFTSGSLTTATSTVIAVSPGPFSRLLVLLPGESNAPGTPNGTVGAPTATAGGTTGVRVNATDAYFNAVNSITDTVGVAATDPNAVLPPNLALVNGTNTLNVTFKTAGSQTVTVSDVTDGTKTSDSDTVNVGPGPLARLQALAPGETAAPGTVAGKTGTPLGQNGGTPFNVLVNSVDANWNLIQTNDTISVSSTDAGAILPPNAALVNGTGNFAVTLVTSASTTVTASDVTHPAIGSGTTSPIAVNGGLAAQTITFGPLANTAYGASPMTLNATASSGLPVSFSVFSGPAMIAGNILTITGTGGITVAASQPGNTTYAPAPNVNQSFTVGQAPLTVTADNKTRAVGSPNPPLTASYAGFVYGENSSVLTGAPALSTTATISSPAGSYPITVAQGSLSAANYSFSFVNGVLTVTNTQTQGGPSVPKPLVAIHDSELTRALETIPASGSTPIGPGTTGFQWWPTNWHYFVMPESLKETLTSDGTAFAVVGDSNILAGALLNPDGSPAFPIVISLAAEAINDAEIAQFTNYVAAGGTLFVGSSAFTRNPDGTPRGDFAFGTAMGVHSASGSLANYAADQSFAKLLNHRLVAHIPGGVLRWRMPNSCDEINAGISPTHHLITDHPLWQVQASDATVLAFGDASPYVTVKGYGKGNFVYDAALEPLLGHGGWAPGMYSYVIFRRAIEWAFESARLPITKLSPWPYAYDAALNVRHDFENWSNAVSGIEASAQFEHTNGVKGDYYFCTGTLRVQMANSSSAIASLRRAVTNYGATIGPHNGGLSNPDNSALSLGDFDYYHWGPDEALDVAPTGYPSGQAYAFTSISNSFLDMERWLSGITNGLRCWAAPSFNATREGSYLIEQALGIKTTGEQKLGPFPSWVLSTALGTAGKRYPFISLPPSDWFVRPDISESIDGGASQVQGTIREMIDFYYSLGALINGYSHSSAASASIGDGSMQNVQDYITYSMAKPRIWSANAASVYSWWVKRATAKTTPTFALNSTQSQTSVNLSGASDPQTAVEFYLPHPTVSGLQVLTNGVVANVSGYRINGQVVKVLVGTSVNNVQLRYTLNPSAQEDFYSITANTSSTISAPGVLANDEIGAGSSLTAQLASGPSHGTVSLNSDGSFTYTPNAGFTGMDSFTYSANDGVTASPPTVVTLNVVPTGVLFVDSFARAANADPIAPWMPVLGSWTITNGMLQGISAGTQEFANALVPGSWGDFSVEGQIQFPPNSAWAGLGGRVNMVSGSAYAAVVYPEWAEGGTAMLRLWKFTGLETFITTPMQQVAIPNVGSSWHSLKLTMVGNQLRVYFDRNPLINVTDNNYGSLPAFLTGGIAVHLFSPNNLWVASFGDIIASTTPIAWSDNYTVSQNRTLSVPSPGVLNNDEPGLGTNLTAVLVSGPSNGTLGFNPDGSFSYTPANNFLGTDTFTYSAKDEFSNSAPTLVSIAVITNALPTDSSNNYYLNANTTLIVSNPGVLANDSDIDGDSLTATLVSGPANGTLNLNSGGGFSYTPIANFTGTDSFVYAASDGLGQGNPATVSLTILPAGTLFYDDFVRSTNAGTFIAPWVNQAGSWGIANGTLQGTGSPVNSYAWAYVTNSWTDYAVQAQFQFSQGSFGGGVAGRLTPGTGARYAAWVYPDTSSGGPNVLKLIKFQTWTAWGYNGGNYSPMQTVNLPPVGTGLHTVTLAFSGNQITVFYDGTQVIHTTDVEAQPYSSGGIDMEMWDNSATDLITVKNVIVQP